MGDISRKIELKAIISPDMIGENFKENLLSGNIRMWMKA
jgi:hypothetical protein